MIKDIDSDAFPDKFRTNIFGKWTKMFMGWKEGDPDFLFEYIDVLLTANTKLCKHMDYLDDMTKGYDYCVVYSYTQDVGGISYKVSIIMTFRSRVAATAAKMKAAGYSSSELPKLMVGSGNRAIDFDNLP